MGLRNTVRCGCCSALMAMCAWLAVPMGDIRLTMQTFGVFLSFLLLGGSKGTAACGAYLLLGAVGIPVFSGFQGGIGVLLGPTGGYLWGFLLSGILFRLLERRLPSWTVLILCQLVCYLAGTLWFYYGYTHSGFGWVLLKCVVPYLIPDAFKLMLAWMLGSRLKNKV